MAKKCASCGREISDEVYCPNCGAPQKENSKEAEVVNEEKIDSTPIDDKVVNPTGKSKIAAGLLGIFLGGFGVHNFYLGYTGKAVAQLLITVLTCGIGSFISSIWGFIEGILILTGNISKDANGVDLVE